MKRILFLSLIAALVLVIPLSGWNPFRISPTPQSSAEEFTEYLDQRIPELMDLYKIPGSSLALVQDGRLVWTAAYGYSNLEREERLTPDTPMRVQSISKSLTAWSILKLVEEGRIHLDAPVDSYLKSWSLPDSPLDSRQITIRQLLSHTSGLPLGDVFTLYTPGGPMPTLQEKLTKEVHPIREPGEAFSYSNTGYNLLELVIEEVTGQPFSDYMAREILQPLGMAHATFDLSGDLVDRIPTGYTIKGEPVPAYVYPEKASGGLIGTASDIAAFCIAGMKGNPKEQQVLSADSIKALYTPAARDIGVYGLVFDSYGLGHYTETLPGGLTAISHGGQGSGIMTHYHSVPESGDGLVILTNSQRSWPFIAALLGDWGAWRGFSPIGMEAILWGEVVLWGITGLLWWALFALTYRLLHQCLLGNRFLIGSLKAFPRISLVQAGVGVLLLAGLFWAYNQKYLFLTSVFPRASEGLGVALFALAVLLLAMALFPKEAKAIKD